MTTMQEWPDIKQAMDGCRQAPPLPDRDAFWADFRSRAQGCARQPPAPSPARWVAAAALALVLASLPFALLRVPPAGAANVINALDVQVAHQAVLIMDDAPSRGTVLWIVTAGDEGNGT